MTPRRLRLLGLMARRETREMSRLARSLGQVQAEERQLFDAADRLGAFLKQGQAQMPLATTRGALASSQAVAATVLSRKAELRDRLDAKGEERRGLETELARHHQRRRTLQDRADATRRAILRQQEARTHA